LQSKDACTLDLESFKSEPIEESEDVDFLIEENSEGNIDNANIGAIANAVKATLANQPGILLILVLMYIESNESFYNLGIDVSGQLQLKVNPSEGKSTQVEVTTEDGHVIVMEIMTEEQDSRQEHTKESSTYRTEDGLTYRVIPEGKSSEEFIVNQC